MRSLGACVRGCIDLCMCVCVVVFCIWLQNGCVCMIISPSECMSLCELCVCVCVWRRERVCVCVCVFMYIWVSMCAKGSVCVWVPLWVCLSFFAPSLCGILKQIRWASERASEAHSHRRCLLIQRKWNQRVSLPLMPPPCVSNIHQILIRLICQSHNMILYVLWGAY